jgi:hypothetical protein
MQYPEIKRVCAATRHVQSQESWDFDVYVCVCVATRHVQEQNRKARVSCEHTSRLIVQVVDAISRNQTRVCGNTSRPIAGVVDFGMCVCVCGGTARPRTDSQNSCMCEHTSRPIVQVVDAISRNQTCVCVCGNTSRPIAGVVGLRRVYVCVHVWRHVTSKNRIAKLVYL